MAGQVGNRWYKCDLHLHTMSSECYPDKTDTPAQWIARAKEQGLEAVAVTDHNDYRGITALMEEGKKQGLAVFPGVEITCDSTKIHMLILFDTDKNADTVRDFLNRCDIDSEQIGKSSGTSMSVFEVCQIAKKRGALVIAAHIDEFNGISSMNPANLDRILQPDYIDAVQVTNVSAWRKFQKDKNADEMYAEIGKKYGPDASREEIDRWRKCYNRAASAGIPMLAFSDNPHSPTESKHGLWGIGSVYTWIQMDDKADLESIRQSLITQDSRIRTMFDSEAIPKTEPDFWIQYLEARKTQLNPHANLHIDFHPQLNIMIGGRGSGKSSIVRLLSGVYHQLPDGMLKDTIRLQNAFYTRAAEGNIGIFREDSEIEICYKWYGDLYRVVITDIHGVKDQKYTFYIQKDTDVWEEINAIGFESLMCAQVFMQRQIYEIAAAPGALLDLVDRSIPDIYLLKSRSDFYLDQVISLAMEKRAVKKVLRDEGRVLAELSWLRNMISLYEDTAQAETTDSPEQKWTEKAKIHLARRNQATELIESCKKQLADINAAQKEALQNYENALTEIRMVRNDFLSSILKNDENYKMEMAALADRESFHVMLSDTLKCDITSIQSDLTRLESVLFAPKDGIESYQELIKEAGRAAEAMKQDGKDAENTSGFSDYFLHLLNGLNDMQFQRLLFFHPEDVLVPYYHPNGAKRYFSMDKASSSEKAAAVLSFILSSEHAPLVLDQPEDNCDNRMIYQEIVSKLKKAKQNRQLIIVTQNANIAANTDAEMITVMDSRGKFVRVRLQGNIDHPEIRKEICDTMEGTEEAFMQRARKYHIGQ